MSKSLAPPAWPIPVPRSQEQTRHRQQSELRAQFPDAAAWYGPKSGRWLAAPTGATGLIEAHTAAGLSALLEQHYKQLLPPTPRPVLPQRQAQRRRPLGDQPPARRRPQHRPAGGGSTTPAARHGRHEAVRRPGRFRRALTRLGLIASPA
ncbi:hypothetical protein [Thermomonospora echinospora]|uniref:hypothetical protein n=1 Tax=Thermomonospora echinospora TaxID=1992 RepID=UPI000CDEEF4F|nr:hypothetical protein [Thermomonospora echinospora]